VKQGNTVSPNDEREKHHEGLFPEGEYVQKGHQYKTTVFQLFSPYYHYEVNVAAS